MKDNRKVIYFSDEINDEFSVAQIEPRVIDKNWVYIHSSVFKKFTHFFWYRMVATPLAWLYLKFKFSHKIINKNILPKKKGNGYFIYGNHTQDTADAFIPTMLSTPKDTYVIVHPNNVSIPYLGKVTPSMGAMPLPCDIGGMKNFTAAIKKRAEDGNAVCIYPEAHIWPYYTDIRPFVDTSFVYPIKYNLPTYCFTNTYQKHGKKVRIVTYVDGPFYSDSSLPLNERKKQLRDEVYSKMKERAKNSNVHVIEYIRKEDDND